MARVTENEVAWAVCVIASGQANGICTFNRARAEIPKLIRLGAGDIAPSQTRAGEPMWHQLIRNIKSHHDADGNYIKDGYLEHVPRRGYRVTAAGKARLQKAS